MRCTEGRIGNDERQIDKNRRVIAANGKQHSQHSHTALTHSPHLQPTHSALSHTALTALTLYHHAFTPSITLTVHLLHVSNTFVL